MMSKQASRDEKATERRIMIPVWLKHWEIYVVIFLAIGLRCYHLETSQYDYDQALMYRMAYDAVHHGLWPVTDSTASLGFANAPGLLYFLMIPALFTANPLAGTILTSVLACISVVITAIFTTRYYGRLAGFLATALYATAATAIFYSRFLWQPNMMFPFLILFMFACFWGGVERRKGWFFPAVLLLGILYQTHGTTLFLGVPLFIALLSAPQTVRWRDVGLSLLGLGVLFLPFLLWHFYTHFHDLQIILQQTAQTVKVDNHSFLSYRYMISPYNYDNPPMNRRSYVKRFMPYTSWLYHAIFYLVVAALVIALVVGVVLWVRAVRYGWKMNEQGLARKGVMRIWQRVVPPPETTGLLMLICWQVLPVVATIKHSAPIYPHYLLMVLPGPFILIAYLISRLVLWLQRVPRLPRLALTGLCYGAMVVLILAQTLAGAASVLDRVKGYYNDWGPSQYYNDLSSIQHALREADRLATVRHRTRVLIGADFSMRMMMFYYSEHMQHPTTVFTVDRCFIQPAATDGPAILVMPPYNDTGNALVRHNGAKLLEVISRLGGNPFALYEMQPAPVTTMPALSTFGQDVQILHSQAVYLWKTSRAPLLLTGTEVLHEQKPAYATRYSYRFSGQAISNQQQTSLDATCTVNALHAGDHLFSYSSLPSQKQTTPLSLSLHIQTYREEPETPWYGPFHLETHRLLVKDRVDLRTADGKDSLHLPVTTLKTP